MTKVFLSEGDLIEVKGSGKNPYKIKKTGGIVDCSCPAWRNIGGTIDNRVCKHIRTYVDRACLLPQAHTMYDNKAVKPVKNGKRAVGDAKPAAVKKASAPPVLLAHSWEEEDPTGWWVSHKLDGVRCWWDGKQFWSRLGNEYHAPQWYKDQLPKNVILDGELFAGRGLFRKTISTVRKLVPTDEEWKKLTYVVYDAPKFEGTFEERTSYLETLFPTWDEKSSPGEVRVLKQIKCKSEKHLLELLKQEEAREGEGLMLRAAGSRYEEGRSKTLLKVKSFFDSEAIVTAHTPGRGKHKGRLGALWVDWDGITFKIGGGLKDSVRKNPPPIGARITFRYNEINKDSGKPKFGRFIAVRDYE